MFVLKRTVEFNDLVTSSLSFLRIEKCVLMKESIYILRVLFLKLIFKAEVNIALLAMHLLQTTIDTKNYLYY